MINRFSAGWWFGFEKHGRIDLTSNQSRGFGWYPLPHQQWHHLALTYRTYIEAGKTYYAIAYYLNGRRYGSEYGLKITLTDPVLSQNMPEKFAIGRIQNDAPKGFTGLVDEVRIYRRDLTESEVEAIYKFER